MDLRLLAAALALPLLLTGCGNDGDDGAGGSNADDPETSAETTAPTESTEPTERESAPAGDLTDEDRDAIEETMVAVLLEPRCDLLTDEYVVAVGLDDEATPQEACASYESFFVDPVYTEDDILLTDLQSTDAGVATIEVGSEYVNITTRYQLTLVDGTWKVSGDEYNTEGL